MRAERLARIVAAACALAGGGAHARGVPIPASPDDAERSFSFEARAGGGYDTNVLRDPDATTQSGVARLDVAGELEASRNLRVALVGWFEQHIPVYEVNETSVDLSVLYRRPIASRLSLLAGSLTTYRREMSNFVEGTVFTHGSTLVTQLEEHASLGLGLRLGSLDVELAGQGHARSVDAIDPFSVYGVSGSLALRYVPNGYVSLRARYLLLFEDVMGLVLLDLGGQPTGQRSNLYVRTHAGDIAVRVRPARSINLLVRYELALIDDNYLGYLYGQEHRLVAGVRFEPGTSLVVDLAGKVVSRSYPLRVATPDNQAADLQYEAIADVEWWLHPSWALFARYELSGEDALPFGQLYVRHAAVLGLAARSGVKW